MKKLFGICLLFLFSIPVYSQDNNYWHSFYDSKKDLYGFKNEKGKVVIPPTFSPFIIAQRFEHIMVAAEVFGDSSAIYYLTKSGKKIGLDSVWMVDNTPDCEMEGFIRFENKATDKMGLLNRKGKVVIPAEYNQLSTVQNGFVIALKDATKNYMGHQHDLGDEHFMWEGGTTLLLDTNNNVIIENFPKENNFNFYSYGLSDAPPKDTLLTSVKGVNGKYFLFNDYEREFKSWLNHFLISLSKEKLVATSLKPLIVYPPYAKEKMDLGKYFKKNMDQFIRTLSSIKDPQTNYQINRATIFSLEELKYMNKNYIDHCGELKAQQYPAFSLAVDEKTKEDKIRTTEFTFIRTELGYKIFKISIW